MPRRKGDEPFPGTMVPFVLREFGEPYGLEMKEWRSLRVRNPKRGELVALHDPDLSAARRRGVKLGLSESDRMLLLCMDRKTAKCASAKQMSASWKFLKRRLKELGLHRRGGILRIKMGCVGICRGGPILLVSPDGTWYGQCSPKVIEQIIQRHLINGTVVEEFVIAQPDGRLGHLEERQGNPREE